MIPWFPTARPSQQLQHTRSPPGLFCRVLATGHSIIYAPITYLNHDPHVQSAAVFDRFQTCRVRLLCSSVTGLPGSTHKPPSWPLLYLGRRIKPDLLGWSVWIDTVASRSWTVASIPIKHLKTHPKWSGHSSRWALPCSEHTQSLPRALPAH